MDAQHRNSNPGSAEMSKRALPVSAGKETQKEHVQKTKVSAVMASVGPNALFGGELVGSVHAPPMEAVLTSTSNKKDSPPRLSPANTPNQQSAQQHATPLSPVLLVPAWFVHSNEKTYRRRVYH